MNTLNCRIWGSTKPLVVHQRPLHSAYVTVRCEFTSTFMLRPFFFEMNTPRGPVRCTVTSASYENILMQRVIPALQERNCIETTVFIQVGAPPHIGRQVQRLLRETFTDERIISRSFPNFLAFKISSPESMWLLVVGILEGSCLPRTFSISGSSEDEHTAIFCSDSTTTAASNNWSRHFTDSACSLMHILKTFCNELIIKLTSHLIVSFTLHFLIRSCSYLYNFLLKQRQIIAWWRKL